MKTKTMKTKTDSAASSGYLERIVRFFRRIKTKPTHHPEIPLGYMVLDGKIVGITVEHVQEGFRNCTTLTNLESIHMPDSITSVAFETRYFSERRRTGAPGRRLEMIRQLQRRRSVPACSPS